MLPDWFTTYTVLADFLGPESLVVSLIEGSSDDGSGELLAGALREHLLFIGVPPENIFLKTNTSAPDWERVHRIEMLARLRNEAMAPIFESETPHLAPDGNKWTHVIWHNDVYFGAQHVLELLHQHETQDSDITCGWDHAGKWFYDGWVGRDMSGDLYSPFPVPKEDEDKPVKFFVSSPRTLERFERKLPFQVFSGWNGMLVINPTPFAPPYNVRFRRGTPRHPDQREGEEECQSSESMFLSWDFWRYGFGRVLTVPGVHLTYGKGDTHSRGWVELPSPDASHKEEVSWLIEPPPKVRCHDWPDKLGKLHWAWNSVRWTDAPVFESPDPNTPRPSPPPPLDH
ncbi:hypothetical protein CspeluHIS016_0301700 [Cutaneotrichosporon spelunceum]|uniref:Glycosyltransferase family 69 protein n=1 Tax=Cutaneotrichosporon spelunceum TaxID=1672016 RepID=A0AAD3YAS8_9TREE|nr:hypothetical protein CspeluHIS016_0301700 [Cutaneotrichosporon spelunceum]